MKLGFVSAIMAELPLEEVLAFASAEGSTSMPTTAFPSRKWRVSAPVRQPRSSTRFPRPIAARKIGIRSGTKTNSPSARR